MFRKLVTTLGAAFIVFAMMAMPAEASTPSKVKRMMHVAVAQKGDWYAYGGAGPSRFDCSGLIYYSARKAGYRTIPRTSRAQAGWVKRISRSNMRRGDLIFFHSYGRVYHVGFYAGRVDCKRYILHSSKPGTRVKTDRIWSNNWFPGRMR